MDLVRCVVAEAAEWHYLMSLVVLAALAYAVGYVRGRHAGEDRGWKR